MSFVVAFFSDRSARRDISGATGKKGAVLLHDSFVIFSSCVLPCSIFLHFVCLFVPVYFCLPYVYKVSISSVGRTGRRSVHIQVYALMWGGINSVRG